MSISNFNVFCRVINEVFGHVMQGKKPDDDKMKEFYKGMAEDIKNEKKRIGGDWAVAHVVLSRKSRNLLR